MRNKLILLALLCLPAFAQEASVIELSPADAQEAQAIIAMEHRLEARKQDFQKRVVRNYIEAPQSQTKGCVAAGMVVKTGWGCAEFQVTPDGRFIVPARNQASPPYDADLYEMINGTPTPIKEKKEPDGEMTYYIY